MNTHLTDTSFGSAIEAPQSHLQRGNNFLVMLAERLLTLMPHLRRTLDHPAPDQLRQQLVGEMQQFQQKLSEMRYDARLATAAHYSLCVLVDETVLKTEWGKKSVWLQQGLLSTFHKETQGGERFYIILKHAMDHVKTHIHLLELMYLCLSLGYEGQYFGKDKLIREEIRNKAFQHIQRYYGKQGRALSPHGEDHQLIQATDQRKALLKKRLLWSCGIFFIVTGVLDLSLHVGSNDVVKQLNAMATDSPVTMFTQLIHRP